MSTAGEQGVIRRRFLELGMIGALVVTGCARGRPSLPDAGVDVGTIDEVRSRIKDGDGALFDREAGAWIVEVPETEREALTAAWDPAVSEGIAAGFLALSQRCPHQGCRVEYCQSSGWFECPCHGSHFSRAGERRKGPADRGLHAFAVAVEDGHLVLRGTAVDGLPGDLDVTGAPDRGGHCHG